LQHSNDAIQFVVVIMFMILMMRGSYYPFIGFNLMLLEVLYKICIIFEYHLAIIHLLDQVSVSYCRF